LLPDRQRESSQDTYGYNPCGQRFSSPDYEPERVNDSDSTLSKFEEL